jgi:hypothetical protein
LSPQSWGGPQVFAVAMHWQGLKKFVHCGYRVEPEKAPAQLLSSQLCGLPQVWAVGWHWQPWKLVLQ